MRLNERDACVNGHDLQTAGTISVNAQGVLICRVCAKEAQARFRAMYRPAKRVSVRRSQREMLDDNIRKTILRNETRVAALEAKVTVMRKMIEELQAESTRLEVEVSGNE